MFSQHVYLNEVKAVQQAFLKQAEQDRVARQARPVAGKSFRRLLGRQLVALGQKLERQPGVAAE